MRCVLFFAVLSCSDALRVASRAARPFSAPLLRGPTRGSYPSLMADNPELEDAEETVATIPPAQETVATIPPAPPPKKKLPEGMPAKFLGL